MGVNTTTTMSANMVSEYYVKKLLQRLTKSLVLQSLAKPSIIIPQGSSLLAKWLRYAKVSAQTPSNFLLSQGVVPSEVAITSQNVTATCLQYGTFAYISDLLQFSATDDVMQSVTDVLSDQAAELVDTILRNEADSNFPNQFANSKSSLATTGQTDGLTAKEILKAVIAMKSDDVDPYEDGLFRAVIHPDCQGDLMNDTAPGGFVDIYKYTNSDKINQAMTEIGKVYGAKVLTSTNISSTTTGTLSNATVYSNLVMGKEALGTVQLGSKQIQMIYQEPGGISDPLKQISTVGFKLLGFVAKYLGGSSNGIADLGVRIRAGSLFV